MTCSTTIRYSASTTANTCATTFLLFRSSSFRCSRALYLRKYSSPRRDFAAISETQLQLCSPSCRRSFLLTPLAALSSFASADGEGGENRDSDDANSSDLPDMAQAFNISSQTASAISIVTVVAALTLPLLTKSLGQAIGSKMKLLSYVTLLLGFYMAWNIGANDVANAMGTSVGSGALKLWQAVATAAVLEFSGALLMGTHVTNTMQKGILVAGIFQGKDSLLFTGLLSSLAAAARLPDNSSPAKPATHEPTRVMRPLHKTTNCHYHSRLRSVLTEMAVNHFLPSGLH
ncbi:Inorganic phosphate transporter 2-1, chloroplastic [Asimina triloba]